MSRHSQATLPGFGLPFHESDGQLNRFQRIEVISRVEGFLPATKDEQVEALGLQSFPECIGGAAKHLAEVVVRQRSANTDDPMRAARKITRNYIDYAKDAQQSGQALQTLEVDLEEVFNPELRMELVVTPEHVGLRPFLRFFDLSILKDDKDFRAIGYDPQRVSYATDNGGLIPFLLEALDIWTVKQVKGRLPEAIGAEGNRLDFWTRKLGEVGKYYPILKPIVAGGLEELHQKAKNE